MKKLLIVLCMIFSVATFNASGAAPSHHIFTGTQTGPKKKNGTPDMRYKANKTAAKPAGPLKKDGTPDMRYKANKTAAKPASPTKKDGTLDKRYKANKTAASK